MIIENRWFVFQGPRRADLSGRPFGFLLVWLGGVGTQENRKPYQPHPYARQFGVFIPSLTHAARDLFRGKYEFLDCSQLLDRDDYVPGDWHKWPDGNREVSEKAVMRALEARPGRKIVSDKSACDRRVDLSGRPLQLYRSIVLKKAA